MNSNNIHSILFSIFLTICIAVHIYGLFTHFNNESNTSHIIHLISYALCLYTYNANVPAKWALYTIGIVYPVAYHANCFFGQLIRIHNINFICLLVTVWLPLVSVQLFFANKNR